MVEGPLKALALSLTPAHSSLPTTIYKNSRRWTGVYYKPRGSIFSHPTFPLGSYRFQAGLQQRRGMKIATLQFAPRLGDVEGNIRRADDLLIRGKDGLSLESMRPEVLVLPELAFSGEWASAYYCCFESTYGLRFCVPCCGSRVWNFFLPIYFT